MNCFGLWLICTINAFGDACGVLFWRVVLKKRGGGKQDQVEEKVLLYCAMCLSNVA